MYTCKDNLIPLLYSEKIKFKKKIKIWHVHPIEYYLITKRNEVLIHVANVDELSKNELKEKQIQEAMYFRIQFI